MRIREVYLIDYEIILWYNIKVTGCIIFLQALGNVWENAGRIKQEDRPMIKIALCDDNKNHQEKIKTLLLEYFKSGASIDIYAEGQKLLRHIEWEGEEAYDLYILDVIMPGLSGIELGKKLRSAGVFAPVIYLTSSKEYAVDSYNVRAFHYLVKPVEKEKLFSVLKQAQNLIAQEKAACITVDTPGGVEVLKLSDILYAELYARSVRYYLAGGTYKDSKKLRVSFQKAVG